MTVKIEVTGIENVKKFLSKKNKEVEERAQDGINKAGLFLHGEVKQSVAGHRAEPTSVDTGRFLNSVDLISTKGNAVIFTKIPYARFLEYGTSRFIARRHFNNSKDRSKAKIRDIIESEVKKVDTS